MTTSLPVCEIGPDSIVGSYRIVGEIGRGGMGTVYEAVHTLLPRRAAIKVMHAEMLKHPGMATRMVQEAALLDEVRHPGITKVFEANLLPDRRVWMAMELVQGETLAAKLTRSRALPAHEVATLLADIADVLIPVHRRGIVHRDLKPDNVLVANGDRDFPIRLIDWGVARVGVGRMTLDGVTPGTPVYMSPEQATGKNIGPACDVYSLGVTAYEALSGVPPFEGRTMSEVVGMHLAMVPAPLSARCGAPADLCALVHRMLDKNFAARPSAVEVRLTAATIAKSLVRELSYESYELSIANLARVTTHSIPTVETLDLDVEMDLEMEIDMEDAEILEHGTTEQQIPLRSVRWTPELGHVAQPLRVIGSRGATDQVSGEIVVGRVRQVGTRIG
ncbi:MAG: serine/threonine protein kinase [Deltaproteobacteria bacterium]|nr:serine/threonine protein kinase [Deltaproteobacteria bacterium]